MGSISGRYRDKYARLRIVVRSVSVADAGRRFERAVDILLAAAEGVTRPSNEATNSEKDAHRETNRADATYKSG